jgi:outer membrane lipoprotein LolB
MFSLKKVFFVSTLAFLISSCTTFLPPAHQTKNWNLQGKIGIKTVQKTESASLYWQQQGEIYHIRLFGPLGIGAVEINGNPNQVIFIDNRGKSYQASSAEMLLKQNVGWEIPVDNLKFWIRALPAPFIPAQKIYDNQQLKFLIQQGWKIEYLDYQGQLPRLIQLTRPTISLRMVIDRWQFY